MARISLNKLIILYTLSRVDYPLTNSQLSEFVLDREYTNYFGFQQALSELVESNLVGKEATPRTSYYRITETGASTLEFFVHKISPEIREEINDYLAEHGYELREEVSAVADYCKLTVGGYAVRLQLKEQRAKIMDLTIAVPTEQAARSICGKWKEKCHDAYEHLIDLLM